MVFGVGGWKGGVSHIKLMGVIVVFWGAKINELVPLMLLTFKMNDLTNGNNYDRS